jgi:crossover junction endodeoxyribonuclease RuvC
LSAPGPEPSPGPSLILGVDPGTRRCGYGVVDARAKGVTYVECGVIEMPARAPLSERLAELQDSLREVVEELSPEVMAVEEVFHGIDARAALVLGHARGVVLAVAGARGLPVFAYPPATVKRSVTGAGRAAKSQVAFVVSSLLKLRRVPSADAADALAVAICHAHHTTMTRLRAASRSEGVRR